MNRRLRIVNRKRRIGWATAILLVPIVAVASPAAGQHRFQQTVVVTAAAVPVELGSATRTVTIITRDQIAQLPVHSVADVLRLVAAVDVRARGERGIQTDFGIRGGTFGQTLVLVDGVRLNDPQTGHHNGDIPVSLDAIERIEVLHGPGSSLFGADAFGGTINIVTRRDPAPASVRLEGGSFDFASVHAQAGFGTGRTQQAFEGFFDRSSGFMYDRDFKTGLVSSRTSVGNRATLTAAYLWKAFGANNFYGGNAPSREWTNQLLLASSHQLGVVSGWQLTGTGSYRTHGDRFLFDQRRPGVNENQHRTHAFIGTMKASRNVLTSGVITVGAEGAYEWIRSTNLGNRPLRRVSGFSEWRQLVGARVQVDANVRYDRYTEFGGTWSPSIGLGWSPGSVVRLRASAARAFRVPTFTERFYSDPANLARPEIGPERAWAGDAGADLFLPLGWLVQATLFARRERDVIDWLRSTPAERWRTYNIRTVNSTGVEVSIQKVLASGALLQAGYTGIELRAPSVAPLLSKYALDFAPRSLSTAAVIPLPGALRVAPRLEYKMRRRNEREFDYTLIDIRVSRTVGRFTVRVDGLNLTNAMYQEIGGVDMPGRSATVSLVIGRDPQRTSRKSL